MESIRTILVLAANPTDTPRLRLDQEIREIENGLQRAQTRDRFVLEQRLAIRAIDVRRAMLDLRPNIIHFCGHGERDGITLEDETGHAMQVGTQPLAGLFELFSKDVHCVLLNACYSEVQASAIARYIPYVVGMKKGIEDRAAIEFAVAFYDALGAGESYEFAYKLGCNAIEMSGLPDYLTPVLKKRQSKRIIEAPRKNKQGHMAVTVGHRVAVRPLLGRDADIVHATKLLRNCSLSLVGIKGIGKSKLASAVFENQIDDVSSPFTTYYWRRLTYEDPPPFVAFARRLVHDLTGRDVDFTTLDREEQIQLLIETMRRMRCLLVIDQFEALIDRTSRTPTEIAYAEFLHYMRHGEGAARVLITSWEIPKDSTGAQFPHLRVTGIPLEAGMALFEKARSATKTDDMAGFRAVLKGLASYVQGHPLALELLARNHPLIYMEDLANGGQNSDNPLEEIASQIVSRIYTRVSENKNLREVLASVCIFSRPSDISAVMAVSGFSRNRVRANLNELLQRGLISLLSDNSHDVHALVRDYILSTLSANRQKVLHRKAADFFLGRPRPLVEERTSIDDAHPVLSAIEHMLKAGDSERATALFVDERLPDQLYTWGNLSELLQLYTRFLDFDIPTPVKTFFLGKLGLVYRDFADYVKAMDCYEKALSLVRNQEDRHAEATQLVNIGDLYDYSGDAERAISFHESALPLARSENDDRLTARVYGCLGNALKQSGRIEEATSYYKKAITICRKIGDKRYEGIWTGDLANVHTEKKDITQALRLYQQALDIARSIGDRMHESWWLGVMGSVYGQRNDYSLALDCLESALVTSTAILFRRGMAYQIRSLVGLGRRSKKVQQVLEIFRTVKALVQKTEGASFDFGTEEYLIAKSLFEEAEKFEREGNYEQASKHYGEAIEIDLAKAEALAQRARCRRILAYRSNRADKYLRAAIDDYSLAIQLQPSNDNYYMLRGACSAQRGDLLQALVDYGVALEMDKANGLAVLGKMEAEICLDHHEDAIKTYETLDAEVLPPTQLVISAWLVCIAKALLGQSYKEHIAHLADVDVILTETADWCNIEIDRYLGHIEKTLPPAQLKGIKDIQSMFRAHFPGS